MHSAGGDTQYSVRHSQSGCISAVQGRRNGGETSEIRVRCDCPPETLLATLANSIVEASCSGMAGRGFEDSAEADVAELMQPVLLAQIGECRHRTRSAGSVATGSLVASIQLISGRIFLRGDIVLVIGGKAFYSENSHLWMSPAQTEPQAGQKSSISLAPEPPTISGAITQRNDLLACVADDLDGACLFYEAERGLLQLGSQQNLLHRPVLHLCGRQFRLDLVARQLSHLDRIRPAMTKDLPSVEAASTAASAFLKSSAHRHSLAESLDLNSTQFGGDTLAPVRTLLLLGGRCMLHSDTLLVLSGLLHFAGSWHRVQTACSGSGLQQTIPRLTGTSMLRRRRQKVPSNKQRQDKVASETASSDGDRPLLLTNVWLYAHGGTVFMGDSAVLTDARLAMSAELRSVALDQQERMLARLPERTRRQVPCRLFLQSGRFCISPGTCSLRAVAGVAWLRGRKAPLGGDAGDQLLVRGALTFLNTGQTQGIGAGIGSGDCGGQWIEGRDLLYKDGLLYLDDLTPVLMGGRICLGQQEMRLDWLSGWGDDSKSSATEGRIEPRIPPHSSLGDSTPESDVDQPMEGTLSGDADDRDLVTECNCLLESGGRNLHLLRGRLRLAASSQGGADTVLIDRGVAYFVAESTRPSRRTAAFPPPKIFGWPLMSRPSESARQWAAFVDRQSDTATFEEARLSLSRGTLWLNGEVPLLKSCRLLLNGRVYDILSADMPMVQLDEANAPDSNGLEELQKMQLVTDSDSIDLQVGQDNIELRELSESATQQQQQRQQQQLQRQQMQQQFLRERSDGKQQMLLKSSSVHGFIGGYSVVANQQTEALIFRLKARFPDGLHFLFDNA